MTLSMTHIPGSRKKQRGIVLVVSLLILMVMTVLGVSMLSSASMGERMASNLQSQNVTFQAAESCVRASFLPASKTTRANAAVALDQFPNVTPTQTVVCTGLFGAGITTSVGFSLPTNPGLMSGYEHGSQYPLAITGKSTLASGASGQVQAGILQKGP